MLALRALRPLQGQFPQDAAIGLQELEALTNGVSHAGKHQHWERFDACLARADDLYQEFAGQEVLSMIFAKCAGAGLLSLYQNKLYTDERAPALWERLKTYLLAMDPEQSETNQLLLNVLVICYHATPDQASIKEIVAALAQQGIDIPPPPSEEAPE